jgi:glycosyltransferase involved in cell wall biosynthesis
MNVLNLVTNQHAQFFEHQVETLRELDVASTTVAVPGQRRETDDGMADRSVFDYVRFYPRVLRHAFDGHDLVHANYGLTAPAALAQPTRPVVLSLWGSDLFGDLGWVSRWCARRADAVIVMSEEMATALEPIETHVVPHGVDLERFRPMPQTLARERVGWDRDGIHVLFPYARGRPVKDYPRAESVVQAAGHRLDVDVTLQTLSGVAHDLMPLYVNAADALLLTSRHEGSPNSVKEAMACNLPVVSTDVGDVERLLADVSNSAVCSTDEELIAALVRVLERDTPSDGRAHVEPLGMQRMGERIVDVYESVCDVSARTEVAAELATPQHSVGRE